jgi:Fic family protein
VCIGWRRPILPLLQDLVDRVRLGKGLPLRRRPDPSLRCARGHVRRKEATQSSRIEGTQTNMDDALLAKEDVALDKRDDWEEVQNYVAAMNKAIASLKSLPFSGRPIRETHEILMQGARGKNKRPGEFRRSQNWIGGASIQDAAFVPPIHTAVPELIADLESFVQNDEEYFPELLKAALIHYQFETIHPFLDGNGRVGRLMITLYLVSKRILKQPILYLSDFFERNKSHYYDNLMKVREQNDLRQWFKFGWSDRDREKRHRHFRQHSQIAKKG